MKEKKQYFLLLSVLLLFSSACTFADLMNSHSAHDLSPVGVEVFPDQVEEITQLTLKPGDVLDIKFYYDQALNEKVTIRPDGKISLQLVDEVQAAGKTPQALDAILTQMYANILKQPEVAVIVRELADQKVYVGGEVTSPMLVPIKGRLTALQAILSVGGVKRGAKLTQVVFIRDSGTKSPNIYKINLKEALADGEKDVLLKPYDIIYVPKTTIAKVGLFVEQYINNIIPKSVGLSFPFVYYLNSIETTTNGRVIQN